MLFDASSCSMFGFQCSIFDSSIISFFCFVCWIYTDWRYLRSTKKSKSQNKWWVLLVIMHTEPIFLNLYYLFSWSANYGRYKYITFYPLLLKLDCILLKIEVHNAVPWTRGRNPLPQFVSNKSSFCWGFFVTFYSGDILLFPT